MICKIHPKILRVIISRRKNLVGHVERMLEKSGINMVLVEKTEGTNPLGRPKASKEPSKTEIVLNYFNSLVRLTSKFAVFCAGSVAFS